MKDSEARQIVGFLLAGFPGSTLEGEAAAVYVGLLMELGDPGVATAAALTLVRELDRMPSVATFRATYKTELRRLEAERGLRQRALEQAKARDERQEMERLRVPDDVRAWAKTHGIPVPETEGAPGHLGAFRPPVHDCPLCEDTGQVVVNTRRDKITRKDREGKIQVIGMTEEVPELGPCPQCERGKALESPEAGRGPWGPEGFWRGKDWRLVLGVG